MNKFIFIIATLCIFTSCEDELIATYEDKFEEPKEEIYIPNDSIPEEEEEEEILYPIGFSVNVNDYVEKD